MIFLESSDQSERSEFNNNQLSVSYDVLSLMGGYNDIFNRSSDKVAQLIPPQITNWYHTLILNPISEIKRIVGSFERFGGHPNTLVDRSGRTFASAGVRLTIDNDGSAGNALRDSSHADNTSWHHNGKSLDPNKIAYVAVPADLAKYPGNKNGPVNLGTLVILERDGKFAACVAGDVGNRTTTVEGRGVGEISVHAADLICVDGNPVSGGTDDHRARIIFTNKPVSDISDFALNQEARAWLVNYR